MIPSSPLGKRIEREPLSPIDSNTKSPPGSLKKGKFLDFSKSTLESCGGAPPPTPRKKSLFATPKAARQQPANAEQVSPFKALADSAKKGTLCSDGKDFTVSPLGRGTFSNVYGVQDNNDIVVKAFHGEKTGFDPKKLQKYLKNIAHNFKTIAGLGLAVGKIQNLNSLETDRYVIQERIPDSVDVTSKDQLEQIMPFFRQSVENLIVMDLQPQNFRVKDGKVYLIDFVEEVEPDEYEGEINIFNFKAIEMWFDAFIEKGKTKEEAIELLMNLSGYSEADICEISSIRTHGMQIKVPTTSFLKL